MSHRLSLWRQLWTVFLSTLLLGLVPQLVFLALWAEPASAGAIAHPRFKPSARAEAELHARIRGYFAGLQEKQDAFLDVSAVGPASTANLTKRAPANYQLALNKGIMLQCLLDTIDLTAIQMYLTAQGKGAKATSEWISYFNLETNGWTVGTDGPGFTLAYYRNIFGVDASKNVYQNWRQSEEVKYNDIIVYEASLGRYGNMYNPAGGLIAADENYSPAAASGLPRNKLVPLQQWSDVVFLAWQQLCASTGNPVYGLNKVFRISIVNENSVSLITTAVQAVGGSMEAEWNDRVTLAAGTPGYYAILGSTNGERIAWLLLQHRPQMTHLTILSVAYFMEPKSDDMCLYFEIGPFSAAAVPP